MASLEQCMAVVSKAIQQAPVLPEEGQGTNSQFATRRSQLVLTDKGQGARSLSCSSARHPSGQVTGAKANLALTRQTTLELTSFGSVG